MLFVKKNDFLFKINLYIYFQIVLMCYVKNNLKILKIYIIFKQFFFLNNYDHSIIINDLKSR